MSSLPWKKAFPKAVNLWTIPRDYFCTDVVDVLTYFKKEEAAPGEELWTRGAGPPQPLQTVTLVLALCFVTLMWNRFIIYINTYLNKICNKFIYINILYVSRKGLFMSKVFKVGAYIYIELWHPILQSCLHERRDTEQGAESRVQSPVTGQ